MSGLNTHPLNNNKNNNNNNNNINILSGVGGWVKKLNHILRRFKEDNVELVKINREFETALTDRNVKEGNNLVRTKRGKKRNVFHLDDYIRAIIVTKGKDPFTKKNMTVEELMRVEGGGKNKNYSNLEKLIKRVKRTMFDNDDYFWTDGYFWTETVRRGYVQLRRDLREIRILYENIQNSNNFTSNRSEFLNRLAAKISYMAVFKSNVRRAIRGEGFHFDNIQEFMDNVHGLLEKLSELMRAPNISRSNVNFSRIEPYITRLESIPFPE